MRVMALVCTFLVLGCGPALQGSPPAIPDSQLLLGTWELELRGRSLLTHQRIPIVGAPAPFLIGQLRLRLAGNATRDSTPGRPSFTGMFVGTLPRSEEPPRLEMLASGSVRADGKVVVNLTFAAPFSGLPIDLVGTLANGAVAGTFTMSTGDNVVRGDFTLRRPGTQHP